METNALPGADTITLPAGAYILTIVGTGEDASATGDLDITDDLTITGAGEAVTSIDGGGLDRVLDVLSAATSVTVSAATIRNGMVSPDADGGGIRNGGILALASVTVGDSTARAGGGIYNGLNNTLTLDDTTVTSNTATTTLGESGEGGGITNRGTLNGTDVTVSDNTATAGFGSVAGGISNYGTATLVNVAVIRNTAFTPGGGGAMGGGLVNSGMPPTGGLTLINATVSGNSASSELGASVAGGLQNQGSLVLNATTISHNTAAEGGGFQAFGGELTAKNTIIADNGGSDCAIFPPTDLISEGHNLDSDGSCHLTATGDLSGADPLLGPLADNGGPTQTHALLAGSPAIDAGDAAACPETDQRDVARPIDGDGDGVAVCDIGACEAAEGTTPPSTPTAGPSTLPPTGGTPTGEGGLTLLVSLAVAVGLTLLGAGGLYVVKMRRG
jgi:hypothetical protein